MPNGTVSLYLFSFLSPKQGDKREALFDFPDIVGFEEFSKGVIVLLCTNFLNLSLYGIVVGRSFHIANNTQGNGEPIAVAHQSEFQLQGIVLTMGIVNKNVVDGVTILAYFHLLQAEAILHQSELVILTEHQRLSVLHVDGILLE